MFTCCPACRTVFRITAETLRAAHGQVRCGRCGTQFDALEHLMETAIAAPVAAPADAGVSRADRPQEAWSVTEEGGGQTAVERAETGAEAAGEAAGEVAGEVAGIDGTVPPPDAGADTVAEAGASSGAATPPDARSAAVTLGLDREVVAAALLGETPERSGAGRRVAASFALLALLAALGLQWTYLQRVPLYERQPALRPWLQRMCDVLPCALPLPRAPERIEVLDRQVRAHPSVAEALLVDLTFVSRADDVVAYPVLELQLSDLSGNRVAGRRFAPREYLPAGTDRSRGLRPNVSQHVTLELIEPSAEVVSFQFGFL